MNRLSQIAAGCVCPGDDLTYMCVVPGGLATEWRGSALNCDNETILLHHDDFPYGNSTGLCNNNATIGQGLHRDGNCYVSTLNLTLTPSLNGQTIECVYKDRSNDIVVGWTAISTAVLFSRKNHFFTTV